ncbi:protein Daple [Brienomyrus brachyistius]|uniref:protein Daple n=1 Tax=Brienomyrus brachyistius TaxID=42636 RepID=UPI0020B1C2C6|nr:protein Daple [Brienomyrus brachyistius]
MAQEGNFVYKLTDEDTAKLIKLRAANDALFTGKRNAAKFGWRAILKELGLQGKMRADQAAKKWENLKKKYKDLKYPPVGHGTQTAEVTSSPWQWFHLMNEAMEGRLAGSAPVLAAISCSTDDEDMFAMPIRKIRKVEEKSEILDFLADAAHEAIVTDEKDGLVMENGLIEMDSEKLALERERVGIERAGLEAERAGLERERVGLDREQAILDRERAALEREKAALERESAVIERQRAQLEKARSALDRDRAALERDRGALERDRAELQRDLAALKSSSVEEQSSTAPTGLDMDSGNRRERFLVLFEQLIKKL